MSSYIRLSRIQEAVVRLSDWRGRVKQQTTAHIFPLLALVEKGVTKGNWIQYEEADDFAFFDRYCRVPGDSSRPYFDPFSRLFRIASHPHSNIATARKNTFSNRWNAASTKVESGKTYWQLGDFSGAIVDNILTKGSDTLRINVIDLAVWLFRDEEFPEGADSSALLAKFKQRFPMDDADFNAIFQYEAEPANALFQNRPVPADDVTKAVTALAYSEASNAAKSTASASLTQSVSDSAKSQLQEDNPILLEVKALLALGTSGIIFKGAPGTGKSWYAHQIALALTDGASDRVFRVQFHPSFSYEDFFDGYVPNEESKSGFKIEGKIFRKAIEQAHSTNDVVVLVIDEINRGDTSRIFGETLTYIERGWRDVPFVPRLEASQIAIPKNLLLLATMNPHDRSITQLDMALLRRFDHIDIPPSPESVSDFLAQAGMSEEHAGLVGQWFRTLQGLMPFGIGHTFFLGVGDAGKLGLIWRYRILPFCESILEFEPARLEDIRRSFDGLERRLRGGE